MGAKRILALGSVAAICVGVAAPVLMASGASATDATTMCLDGKSVLSGGGYGPPAGIPGDAVVFGVNLAVGTCNGIGQAADGVNGITATSDTATTGPNGPTGATGATGAAGAAGPQGAQGPTGPTGAVGNQGPAGAQGVAGNNGAVGPTGATGSPGGAGAAGSTGATGAAGLQGLPGNDGPQGPAGVAGATGATGAKGPIPAVQTSCPTGGGTPCTVASGQVTSTNGVLGNVTGVSTATCPVGTALISGGAHIGQNGTLRAAISSNSGNHGIGTWSAEATVVQAGTGAVTMQAIAICQ